MYQHLFTKFLKAHEGKLHFAAHSHHFWPDISLDGQIKAWELAAESSDHKWEIIFNKIYPQTQKFLAQILHLDNPDRIVFASNTHDHLIKILSLLNWKKKIRILTTNTEFYSFSRQIQRLLEDSLCEVVTIKTDDDLEKNIIQNLNQNFDLVFLSHVSFKNGRILQLEKLLDSFHQCQSLIVIDGYHAIGAIPTIYKNIEKRCFILGGGYKYLMSGEGLGFMSVPDGDYRPLITGWFSHFGSLTQKNSAVQYGAAGAQFLGATFDPTPLMRFNSIWEHFGNENLNVEKIHEYCQKLMTLFLKNFDHSHLLYSSNINSIGHFLTLVLIDQKQTQNLYEKLLKKKIIVDYRENHLRIGFGIYQMENDVLKLCQEINLELNSIKN
jgi:selenocysteine lyase/cysteine desulfurase